VKLNYLLDLGRQSRSFTRTPSLISKQLPFYITDWGHYFALGNYFTEREKQDNYLLIYTVSGSGILKYYGEEYIIKPQQAFLINCFNYQFYKTGPEGLWEIKWVHFNGPACPSYHDLINEDLLYVITFSDPSKLLKYLDEIPGIISKGDMLADVIFSMLITNILSELMINKLSPVNNKKYYEQNLMIERVIAFIETNYDKKINMDDFVKIVHMSEYHFLRLFKKYIGVGPYEYLINYRINKSKTLLKETNLSVNEIAYQVGFNNINNFIRDFKKLVGITPLKYRNFWII
jgi:AraC-like DNA-binding protein